MKSKLLKKLKKISSKEVSFFLMYVFGCLSIGYNVGVHDWPHSLSSLAFVIAVLCWQRTSNVLTKVLSSCDVICRSNDELITVNKELSDKYKQELSIAQGLISENKDLKMKLKNERIENSRIRKGGNRNE